MSANAMSDQGKEWASFIQAELKSEHERRTAADQRAAAAVTSNTGIVTLVIAVLAVLVGRDFTFSGPAKWALFASLSLFLGAAVLALWAGIAKRISVLSLKSLEGMLDLPHWTETEVSARNTTAYCNVRLIEALRHGTNVKFRILLAASGAQIAAVVSAVVSLAIAV